MNLVASVAVVVVLSTFGFVSSSVSCAPESGAPDSRDDRVGVSVHLAAHSGRPSHAPSPEGAHEADAQGLPVLPV